MIRSQTISLAFLKQAIFHDVRKINLERYKITMTLDLISYFPFQQLFVRDI